MFALLVKFLPFLAPLVERFLPGQSQREKELKAEKEVEEMKAFAAGRICPRFLFQFVAVASFALIVILSIIAAFSPDSALPALRHEFIDLVKTVGGLFGS